MKLCTLGGNQGIWCEDHQQPATHFDIDRTQMVCHIYAMKHGCKCFGCCDTSIDKVPDLSLTQDQIDQAKYEDAAMFLVGAKAARALDTENINIFIMASHLTPEFWTCYLTVERKGVVEIYEDSVLYEVVKDRKTGTLLAKTFRFFEE